SVSFLPRVQSLYQVWIPMCAPRRPYGTFSGSSGAAPSANTSVSAYTSPCSLDRPRMNVRPSGVGVTELPRVTVHDRFGTPSRRQGHRWRGRSTNDSAADGAVEGGAGQRRCQPTMAPFRGGARTGGQAPARRTTGSGHGRPGHL